MDGQTGADSTLFPARVGERLRAAREAQGLDIGEIASRTRIPQRHLEAIEKSNYSGLPSSTYAVGFAKAYARAVGADEVAIAREVRAELGDVPIRPVSVPYEMHDPTRVPPPWLAWGGALFALVVLIGVGLWYGTGLFRGGAPASENLIAIEPGNATAAVAEPVAAPGGQVTLVATDTVWLRITDANGKRLFEKEMVANERYDVPADADRPRVRTVRPDRIQVLLNGSSVPPLGLGANPVEVEVTAAALQARGQPNGAAAPSSAPAARPAVTTSAGSTTQRRSAPTPSARPTPAPTASAAATAPVTAPEAP
ncbi:helix-turn-helix domain-containing protein [Sphingomonas sp. M1-B02]|uniref:helix-turn-helix domain-containing protein n=1 Tax=Sphingomonas sp. M1-B02 TaxID=3114300 RepID=UPI00223F595E|nr:helix-turn-helix domain-containing protein [Sphingomonas sp. S6-11]UZK65118.1 helix-turn-helix domain-containing protein [Sphingomonas sp. S6-11]